MTRMLLPLLLAACAPKSPLGAESEPEPAQATLVSAPSPSPEGSNMSVALFTAATADNAQAAMSPASVQLALQLVRTGAAGGTAAALDHVFGGPTAGSEFLGAWSGGGPSVSIANRLFASPAVAWKQPFQTTLADTWQAELAPVDFATDPEGGRRHVNRWISDQTGAMIPELLPAGSIRSDTRLVLANAIYFRGDWASPFNADRTVTAPFMRPDASVVEVPTMVKRGHYGYAEVGGTQILELPYEGGDLAMTVWLPAADSDVPTLLSRLSGGFAPDLDRLQQQEVVVRLPRFEARATYDLTAALGALGLGEALARPNLSGMTDEAVRLDQIVHEAVVRVDEQGTEAAAATGVTYRSARVNPARTFTADRPFFFVIRDRRFDTPLFVGTITDPS